MMDVLPAWAEALFREKFGLSEVTRVEVLKDTPFHKILVGYTPTSAVLAEKGLLGRNAYLLPTGFVNPAPAAPATGRAPRDPAAVAASKAAKKAVRPKARRPASEAKAPPKKAQRGKVAPRRKPPAKPARDDAVPTPGHAPPLDERATPSAEATEERPRKEGPGPQVGLPLDRIEGIGTTYGEALRAHGVRTVEELLAAEAPSLAARADIAPELVAKWQAMATLQQVDVIGPQSSELLVRAGLRDLRSLAQETPESLAKRLGDYESGLGVRVQNLTITPDLCAGWIQGARETLERRGASP